VSGNVRIVRIVLTVVAVLLWTFAAADIWTWLIPARAVLPDLAAAVTSTIIAALCWLLAQRDDHRKRLLVRELVDVYLDEQRPTRLASRRLS
jgi:hypothetical protein